MSWDCNCGGTDCRTMDLPQARPEPATVDLVEAVAKAMYVADNVWQSAFPWPKCSEIGQADGYRLVARAAIDAMQQHLAAQGLLPDGAWQELVEKDDRTSPAEYPDMALITREELADFMSRAR